MKFKDVPPLDMKGLEILDSTFHLPQNMSPEVLSREQICITEGWPWRDTVYLTVERARALYEWLGTALP